jgi:hypothetical protein
MKFKDEYGQLIIACDSRNNWRKQVFPYYKAHRKKERDESSLDWDSIFKFLNLVREELRTFFPYPVVEVETAEADDVIAAFVKQNPNEKILIISGDKDFIQLHNANVKQYDPVKKKFIKHDDPKRFLVEHILRGDKGDGVPNVLSDDDTLVLKKRSRPLSAKKVDRWINGIPESEKNLYIRRNLARNEQLIDLGRIPEEILSKVQDVYATQTGKDRSKLMGYFMKYKLRNLMADISDF